MDLQGGAESPASIVETRLGADGIRLQISEKHVIVSWRAIISAAIAIRCRRRGAREIGWSAAKKMWRRGPAWASAGYWATGQ
jgi:hypothetical protein